MTQANNKHSKRIGGLDALRGLIMVVMALDHANHFVAQKHPGGENWAGVFPAYGGALPFLIRAVTHLAAPGFFFLMGTGMALFAESRRAQGWDRWRVARHFVLRGVLLMALQFTVVNPAWMLSAGGWEPQIYFGVLWALGAAMLLGAALIWLPAGIQLGLGLALIVAIEPLLPDPALWPNGTVLLRRLLLVPGGDTSVWVNYPVLPWLGVALAGMAYHWLLRQDRRIIRRWTLIAGAGLLAVFGLVRTLNGFGNIRPWEGSGWIEFFNVVKYPPSGAFLSLTMGINLLLLGWFAGMGEHGERLLKPLIVFGRTPLFFYVAHLYIYLGLGWVFTAQGSSQPLMLILWLAGLLALYPLCLWYGKMRAAAGPGSVLRYL